MLYSDLKKYFALNNNELNLHDYIQFCLYSKNGFYNSNFAFGKSGSFITSPMISSIFGDLVALFLINLIQSNQNFDKINIIEIGSGNGNLLFDIISRFTKYPDIYEKIIFISIEKGIKNKEYLSNKFKNKVNLISNIDNIGNFIEDNPCFFISNELLDAYPVNQYIFEKNEWWQTKIRILNGKLLKFLCNNFNKTELLEYITKFYTNDIKMPKILEISLQSINDFTQICKIINKNNGGMLYFDYGYINHLNKSTIQGIYKHKKVDILNIPCDITHLINFSIFYNIVENNIQNFTHLSIENQGNFLKSIGIEELANIYKKNAKNNTEIDNINQSVNRLTNEMGDLFKILLCYKF